MKPLVVLLALLGAALPQAAVPDEVPPRLRTFLAEVQSLSGDFRQEVVDSGGRVVEVATGSVSLARPGKFRWDYREPFERVIVADGERIWLFEADLAQVTIRRLTDGIGDTPAALLTGRESVLARFDVSRSWREAGIDWVMLTPKAADSDFAAVTLGFEGPALTRLRLDDRLGQQTRVDLSALRLNPKLPPATFEFQVPAGADVIDDSEL